MAWSFDRGGATRIVSGLILGLLLASGPARAQHQTGPESSRALLDFQLGRIGHRLAFAISGGDTLALPAETVLGLAEMRVQRSGRKLVVSPPGQRPMTLDGGSGRALVGGKTVATGVIAIDSVVYAPPELLAAILGTEIKVDLEQATVTII